MENISKSEKVEKPMVVRNYAFDPKKDLHEVDQFGAINLRDAFENGTIEGSLSFEAEKYNGVSDASVMMHRPLDQFEALRQSEYVKGVLKSAKEAETNVSASATASE